MTSATWKFQISISPHQGRSIPWRLCSPTAEFQASSISEIQDSAIQSVALGQAMSPGSLLEIQNLTPDLLSKNWHFKNFPGDFYEY